MNLNTARRAAGLADRPNYETSREALHFIASHALSECWGAPSHAMRVDFDLALSEVLAALHSGDLVLDYLPADNGSVSLPAVDHVHYIQAVLYWTHELGKPFPRVIEACGRAGDGASVEAVLDEIKRIEHEDRMCRTDVFPLPA